MLNGKFDDINICTEYSAPCAPHAWRSTSSNLPIFGDGIIGIIVFNSSLPNTRSYLQSRLADTLKLGEKYRLSLDIRPGNSLINEIGIVLSDTLIHTKSDILLKVRPYVEFTDNKKLLHYKKGKEWLHLEKEFTADNKSIFIIIGNYYPENSLIKKSLKSKIEPYRNYLYFIDNVKLKSVNNIHNQRDIEMVKNLIYAQHQRHPVPDSLFELKKFDFLINNKETEVITRNSDTVLLYGDLLFAFDSFKPSKNLIDKVDSIFKDIKYMIDSIEVVGNTDNIGSDLYNHELSFKRAKTVAKYIVRMNILPKEKIIFHGVGSKFPIDSNSTKEGRYKNRRVEVIIKYKI